MEGQREQAISIHALREEGDCYTCLTSLEREISIHALREEGDGALMLCKPGVVDISIHALREEGDGLS